MDMRILSVQVGMPRAMLYPSADGEGARWSSGIFKQPVEGPVRVGRTNLEGDGQDDLAHHGGEDRAVLLFCSDNFASYEKAFDLSIPPGGFGENLTVRGADESSVCLGDVWQCDGVELEVSQPRLPCFKLGRRLDRPAIVKAAMASRAAGWYCRVLREGYLGAGSTLSLARRPYPEWTVTRGFDVFVYRRNDRTQLEELAAVPTLSNLWKSRLAQMLGQGTPEAEGDDGG